MGESTVVIGLVLLAIVLIIVGPLLSIWAINTLFGLGIAYNIKTWAAMILVGLFFHTRVLGGKS